MKSRTRLVAASVTAASLVIFASSGFAKNSNSEECFEKVKSLAGMWQGKDEDGQKATVKYEVTSGGTAVMEELKPGKGPTMITMYHMDGDKLMCTHYCARNNQPRMVASSLDDEGKTIKFDFLDATNMTKPDDGHMHDLKLTLDDKDHLTQNWSWHEGDQHSQAIFHFERVPSADQAAVKSSALLNNPSVDCAHH
jgi:hypothetical protein